MVTASDLPATPPAVAAEIDTINSQLGWPHNYFLPCPGSMVEKRELIEGIEVSSELHTRAVSFRVAGILVGTAPPSGGIGLASARCLLPHHRHLPPRLAALHDGGAFNQFQLHLLTEHGTHGINCIDLSRRYRCRVCRETR